MHKTHIRSYRTTDAGDVSVTHWNKGERVELSKHYGDVAYDRRQMQLETALDVFRYEDDRLTWALSVNGQDVPTALTVKVLLDLFLRDVEREVGDPRGF